jgi:hypothetical protein
MAVDDHGIEALRKAAEEVTPGDKSDYYIKIAAVNNSIGFILNGPVTIGPGTTIVDTTLLSTWSRLDYIINFKDNPITVTKSLKLIAQNNAGTITDSVSERMGGPINVQVSLTDDAIDGFLSITNNEAFNLDVTFLKAITP